MTMESPAGEGEYGDRPAAEEMARLGITRVPVDYFYFKEFRYTRLDDALAQARREGPAAPADERISGHFSKGDARGVMQGPAKRVPDSPGCDTKGNSIVEGGYTR